MADIDMKTLKARLQDMISSQVSRISGEVSDSAIKDLIGATVRDAARASGLGMNDEELDILVQEMINEFLYFGPLQPLFSDPEISEIMVNGDGKDEEGVLKPPVVWIEKHGKLERAPYIKFDDDDHVKRVMNRICARQGRHIDDANPIEDASLPDGSRFNGTIYPAAVDGSTFNIRRFQQDRIDCDQYVSFGTCTNDEMRFLATCVAARCSILISGGTGSGKTTLLNILSGFIPQSERIITIEDTCELLVHKHHPHVVRLEARKANAEGIGEITLDDHLRSALRKRPDRIIVGECRGPEAYTMLEAMNTGHEGSMTTIHANDPVAALTRLATLVMQGDSSLSEDTVKTKIAQALDLVVQIERLSDGSRKVTKIEAVNGFVDGMIQHDPLFEFKRDGVDENDNIIGRHHSFGSQPGNIRKKISAAGYEYDPQWFLRGV